LSETFDRGPATRHLVVVAALDPSADALGPRATLAWPTVVERMDQVRKLEATQTIPHYPPYLGRYPAAPDRPIPVGDGGPNRFVLGAGRVADSGFLNNSN
jgi:hypothetical protein